MGSVGWDLGRVVIPPAGGAVTSLWLYYHDPAAGAEVLRAYSYDVAAETLALVNEVPVPTTAFLSASDWTGRNLFNRCSFGDGGEIAFDQPTREYGFLWTPATGNVLEKDYRSGSYNDSPMVWSGGEWHFIRSGSTYGGARLRRVNAAKDGFEDVSALDSAAPAGTGVSGSDGTHFFQRYSAGAADGYVAFLLTGAGSAVVTDEAGAGFIHPATCDPADPGEAWFGGYVSGPGAQVLRLNLSGGLPTKVERYPDEAPWQKPPSTIRRGRSHYRGGQVLFSWHGFNFDDDCVACEIRIHGSISATTGETPDQSFDAPADPAGSLYPWAAAIRSVT